MESGLLIMKSEFWSFFGIGIMALCMCFGCAHCETERDKSERYQQQTEWLKAHPESYEKLSQ